MRQVGTSLGGTGSFGGGDSALDGSGGRDGGNAADRGGLGMRRDGRGDGRDRAFGGRDGDARARAFRDRMDDARRRLGPGTDRKADGDVDAHAADEAPRSAPSSHRFAIAEGSHPDARLGHRADADAPSDEPAHDDGAAATTAPRGAEAPGDGAPRRLLAAAEPPADALSALFAPPAAAAAPAGAGAPVAEAGAPAAVERRIADIADRVERALQADLAAGSGDPIALRIPLDGAEGGLSSLTVTATAEGLDVTLGRVDGGTAPSPELLQAAQGLAERLQRRLGRGSVRVFEGVEAAAAARPAEGGLAGLSAILGRGTG